MSIIIPQQLSISHLSLFLLFLITTTLYKIKPIQPILLLVEASSTDPIQGRYSFSLTTFDPTGQLPQLSHAIKACTLGPPTIAISLSNGQGTIMASLQEVPSPLISDDGTCRFIPITDHLWIGHSGINADGRQIIAEAIRIAIEHSYTFQEEIPMNVLLEELALIYQEYTMIPGSRPFGSSLLILDKTPNEEEEEEYYNDQEEYNNHDDNDDTTTGSDTDISTPSKSKMYTIDPSGSVMEFQHGMAFIGRGDYTHLFEKLEMEKCAQASTVQEAMGILLRVLKEEMKSHEKGKVKGGESKECHFDSSLTFVCAMLSKEENVVRRVTFQ